MDFTEKQKFPIIKTRINGKIETGRSFASIIGKLLKRPLHKQKDKEVKMIDIQKLLLKKRV
jgi:hypothetical protein